MNSSSAGLWSHRVRSYLGSRVAIVAGLLGLGVALPFFSAVDWRVDLFAHFVLYRLIGAVLLLGLAVWSGAKKSVIVLIVCLFVDGLRMAPLYGPRTGPVAAPVWKVLYFNVLTQNSRKAEVLRYLESSKADLIFVAEVDDAWARALRGASNGYRVIAEAPRSDNFGILALSAVESATASVQAFGPFGLPAIELRATKDQHDLEVLAVHLPPPISEAYADARDRGLDDAAQWAVARTAKAAVVLGDLNATPWSHVFRAFLERTKWRSAQDGFGYQPTWLAAPGLMIPIDHLLHSPGLGVSSRRVGPELGSDHRAIEVELGPLADP